MDYFYILLCTLFAYVLGSIPTVYWIGKFIYGIDLREHGTGSLSHLNMIRVLGSLPGNIARVLDVGKGFLAANLAFLLGNSSGWFEMGEFQLLELVMGLAAMWGHIFSVFSKFKGGKGFHVMIGVLAAVHPPLMLICLGASLVIYLLSEYPNLGYVVGTFVLPFVILISNKQQDFGYMYIPLLIFCILLFVLIAVSHQKSIVNIISGTEEKLSL